MESTKFKECNDWKVAFDVGAPKRWKKDVDNSKKLSNNE